MTKYRLTANEKRKQQQRQQTQQYFMDKPTCALHRHGAKQISVFEHNFSFNMIKMLSYRTSNSQAE